MARITLAQLKDVASRHGYSARKRDGEFRVAPYRPADPAWCEARAYYSDDIVDAMDTLLAMIAEESNGASTTEAVVRARLLRDCHDTSDLIVAGCNS